MRSCYSVPSTIFGKYPKGSVLSYHQPLESNCIINIYDGIAFPDLPLVNVIQNEYSFVLTESQLVKFEGLNLQLTEIYISISSVHPHSFSSISLHLCFVKLDI
jgi:hypothetical protein